MEGHDIIMCNGVVLSVIFLTELKYAVHLYRPLQLHRYAVFSASLCQPVYSKV